jgi:hypothetical protein
MGRQLERRTPDHQKSVTKTGPPIRWHPLATAASTPTRLRIGLAEGTDADAVTAVRPRPTSAGTAARSAAADTARQAHHGSAPRPEPPGHRRTPRRNSSRPTPAGRHPTRSQTRMIMHERDPHRHHAQQLRRPWKSRRSDSPGTLLTRAYGVEVGWARCRRPGGYSSRGRPWTTGAQPVSPDSRWPVPNA